MRSTFSVSGHPIHPMLIGLPVGLILWTFVADLVFLTTDNPVWNDIALWSGIAAVGGGVLAAIPGLGDYVTMPLTDFVRKMATGHMLLNLLALGLFGAAAGVMWGEGAISGGTRIAVIVMHGAGLLLVGASGWLGGEMVYKYRLGVVEASDWVPVWERDREQERTQPRP